MTPIKELIEQLFHTFNSDKITGIEKLPKSGGDRVYYRITTDTNTYIAAHNINVKENILADEKYKYLFSVEEVNKLVLEGTPFRDAYKKVGLDIEAGTFTYTPATAHTHEGSIGNLCNEKVKQMMDTVIKKFNFTKVNKAIQELLK